MKFSNLLPDLPFPQPSLRDQFQKQHERFVTVFPGWSVQSTRRKLIVNYWFEIILNNYFKLLVPACILVSLVSRLPASVFLSVLIPAGALVFVVLFVSLCLPLYHIELLSAQTSINYLHNLTFNFYGNQSKIEKKDNFRK